MSHGGKSSTGQAVGRALLAELAEHVGSPIILTLPGPAAAWSRGSITVPECINTRTFRPERGGVRCARVFGYVLDNECLCTKYSGAKYLGVVCDRCGVEVGSTQGRAVRFGHIPLAAPVLHPWCRAEAAAALGLDPSALEPVLAGESTEFDGTLCGVEAVTARVPAELTLRELPVLPPALRLLRYELGDREADPDAFCAYAIREEWGYLPKPPAGALSRAKALMRGADALYAEILRRNVQLAQCLHYEAPALILRAESYELQRAVDALFGPPSLRAARRNLRRLIDLLAYRLDERFLGEDNLGEIDRTLQAALLSRATS
jgi:DNA-directed RNA polymerase subunit beta'